VSAPFVSVVVPTIDRPDLVLACLDGIAAGTFRDFEVVVVDQSRDDRTRAAIAARFGGDPRVRYLHSAESGAARARNLGAAAARGEILAFVDDDAIPEPGWLAAYASAFRDLSPAPGMVGGRLTPMWERPCPAWFPPGLAHLLGAYDAGDRVREFPPGDFPMSGNFALPRALMERVGGFDPRLGFDVRRRNPLLGGEDSHLGLKVRHAGRAVVYHPGAEVRHLVRAAKLSPRYLLHRQYWAGRTYAQLRLRADGDRRGWGAVLRDAVAKRADGPAPARPRAGAAAAAVLAAALAAFAAGMAVEAVAAAVGPRAGDAA
jgi:GT2 family glycosyltransferase